MRGGWECWWDCNHTHATAERGVPAATGSHRLSISTTSSAHPSYLQQRPCLCLDLSLIQKRALMLSLVLAPLCRLTHPHPHRLHFPLHRSCVLTPKIKHKLHPTQMPAWFIQSVKLQQNVLPEGNAFLYWGTCCHQNTHRELLVCPPVFSVRLQQTHILSVYIYIFSTRHQAWRCPVDILAHQRQLSPAFLSFMSGRKQYPSFHLSKVRAWVVRRWVLWLWFVHQLHKDIRDHQWWLHMQYLIGN